MRGKATRGRRRIQTQHNLGNNNDTQMNCREQRLVQALRKDVNNPDTQQKTMH